MKPEDLRGYHEQRITTLVEDALRERNPVLRDLEQKLDLQVISTDPSGIAIEIMASDQWPSYPKSFDSIPINNRNYPLDEEDIEYLYQDTGLYMIIEYLQSNDFYD